MTPTSVVSFEEVRWLNSGGMAEVFLARKPGPGNFDKVFVVKRMLPHLRDDPNYIAMFQDEARLAALFRHPNLPQVFELGDDDGLPYYTMEYLEGADCRELHKSYWRQGRLIPLPHVIEIVTGAALGLHSAHHVRDGEGRPLHIVHRDVSPSNLFVTIGGGVKVVDFGVARAEYRRAETQAGLVKGKLVYMSPEQIGGRPVDLRSDIFSLGTLIYELTVGDRPFDESGDGEVARAITSGRYRRPSAMVTTYPEALEAIVIKCLQVDPDARYPNADALAADLESFKRTLAHPSSLRLLGAWMSTQPSFRQSDDTVTVRTTVPNVTVDARPGTTGGGDYETHTLPLRSKAPSAPSRAPAQSSTGIGVTAVDGTGATTTAGAATKPADVAPDNAPAAAAKPPHTQRRSRGLWGLALAALVGVVALGLWSTDETRLHKHRTQPTPLPATERVDASPTLVKGDDAAVSAPHEAAPRTGRPPSTTTRDASVPEPTPVRPAPDRTTHKRTKAKRTKQRANRQRAKPSLPTTPTQPAWKRDSPFPPLR